MAAAQSTTTPSSATGPERAVLVELENVALGGRQLMFDAVKRVLSDKGATLTPAAFAACCLDRAPGASVEPLLRLLDKAKLAKPGLQAEVVDAVRDAFAAGNVKLAPAMTKLLALAEERSVPVGLLSCLDDETAKLLADRLGLDEKVKGMVTNAFEEGKSSVSGPWAKLAIRLRISPRKCVAVTTSRWTFMGALAAGMQCVVIPDRFTNVGDFGGANAILDAFDGEAVQTVAKLLEQS